METNIYMDSVYLVIRSPHFFFYMGLVVSFGMIVGGRLNEGMAGLKKSMFVLIPFGFVLFMTTSSRIFFTSNLYPIPLSANAYNGIFTLLFTGIFYFIGLLLGHTVVSNTVKKIYRQKDIDPNEKRDLISI